MKVISDKILPAKVSLIPFALWYLVLDRFKAPGWAYGVFGTILVLNYVFEIFKLFNQSEIDIFEDAPAVPAVRRILDGAEEIRRQKPCTKQ